MQSTLLAAAAGILSGLASSLFLYLLNRVTDLRLAHPELLWGLPFAGFCIGWVYLRFGREAAAGNRLILEEIHEPKKTVPPQMAPLILLTTLTTHLFGGSAGREGTAVQMGASLADQLSRWLPIDPQGRRRLLMAGAAAGFGSAVGAPWAGLVFGLEVVHGGAIRPFAAWDCAVAAATGYATTLLVGAPHTLYPTPTFPVFNQGSLALAAGLGILCGLAARLFIRASHRLERSLRAHISYAPLRPALVGVLMTALFIGLDLSRFAGLGLSVIQDALRSPVPWYDPLLKAGFTSLTVGSGFKGGEFIPLVFVGSTMGNVLGWWLAKDMTLMAAVGFAAVFAGASNTPLACTVMAVELFGWPIAPYAAAGCYLSFLVSGKKGIYSRDR